MILPKAKILTLFLNDTNNRGNVSRNVIKHIICINFMKRYAIIGIEP